MTTAQITAINLYSVLSTESRKDRPPPTTSFRDIVADIIMSIRRDVLAPTTSLATYHARAALSRSRMSPDQDPVQYQLAAGFIMVNAAESAWLEERGIKITRAERDILLQVYEKVLAAMNQKIAPTSLTQKLYATLQNIGG